jgi:hypothetical protein
MRQRRSPNRSHILASEHRINKLLVNDLSLCTRQKLETPANTEDLKYARHLWHRKRELANLP